MTTYVRKGIAAALACATALVLMAGVLPQSAFAAVSAVYTATVTPSYANPATGQIEDSGGSSNQALGESMVTSTTKEQALVETDVDGNTFVTLRIGLIDQIESVSVECSEDGGSTFSAVEVTEMQRDESHGEANPDNTGDFRFQAPSDDCVMRVKLDVIPMGREVVYFVQLSDLVEGNSAGFVETIVAGVGEPDDAAAAASDDAANGAESAEQQDADAVVSNDSSASGVSEFDADGNNVTDDSQAKPLSGAQIAMIVGGVVVVAAIAGIVVYAAYVRPKRAREAAAAAAAAKPAKDNGKDE